MKRRTFIYKSVLGTTATHIPLTIIPAKSKNTNIIGEFGVGGNIIPHFKMVNRKDYKKNKISSLNDFTLFVQNIFIIGELIKFTEKTTKSNKKYGEIIIQDESGCLRVLLFSKFYQHYRPLLIKNSSLTIKVLFKRNTWPSEIVTELAYNLVSIEITK